MRSATSQLRIAMAWAICAAFPTCVYAGNVLNIGVGSSPNDNTGDPLRTALQKTMTAVNGLASCFNGAAAPASMMTYQCWFDTSTTPATLRYFDGTTWVAAGTLNQSTHAFQPGGSVGGDLTGSLPNPTINALAITNSKMAVGAAAANIGTLSGDFSGTLPAPAIAKIQGTALTGTTGAGNAVLDTSPTIKAPIITDRFRTFQSYGAVGNGIADDTTAVSNALASGNPILCNGSFVISSLVTATNVNVHLQGGTQGCTFIYSTSQSMIHIVNNSSPNYRNTVDLYDIEISVRAAITAVTGPLYTAAFFIDFPNGASSSAIIHVNIDHVHIGGNTGGHYIVNGIALYDTPIAKVRNLVYEGNQSAFIAGTSMLVLDGTHIGGEVTVRDSLADYTDIGIHAIQETASGWQGVRVDGFDCVFCNEAVEADGSLDGTSAYVTVTNSEGQVAHYGIVIKNSWEVFLNNNNFNLFDMPLSGGSHIAFPACIQDIWTIGMPSFGASTYVGTNSCDGISVTGYTARYGVQFVNTTINTNMSSYIAPQLLNTLEKGIVLDTDTQGVLIAHQALRNVGAELLNNSAPGANIFIPPLGVTDGSSAPSGLMGERQATSLPVGSAVSLTSGIPANVTSLSVPVGNWQCQGNLWTMAGGGTITNGLEGSISTVSGTHNSPPTQGSFLISSPAVAGSNMGIPFGQTVLRLTSSTPLYLVATGFFSGGALSVYGGISCTRFM
jgi:hypothetical protein